MTKKFDEKQQKLIEFIKKYSNKHGYSPSYREMAKAIGLKSTSTMNYYIKRCEEQGLIRKDNHRSRTITVCETTPPIKIDGFELYKQMRNGKLKPIDFARANLKEKIVELQLENRNLSILLGEQTMKNQDLEMQLAEKDKEIEFLTKQNKALVEEEDLLGKKLKELGVDCIEDLYKIRHQICEQIRENAYFDHYTDADGNIQAVYCIEPEKLKEIEGKNK